MKLVYIAGRYRDAYPYQVHANIQRAWGLGIKVAALGAYPIIPHCNSEHMEGIQEGEFFIEGTLELCKRCDAMITVPEGLETSEGTQGEIKMMTQLGKPVFHNTKDLDYWLNGMSDPQD